ncbi:hypothetical protein GCM10023323_23090 [Streptomyces thinghirensis]|uniref:Uncharacterized protein n=1 Tax=Streptomyces thinghirensis TaxID=551547 RepID=A0ABP9T2M8_9ACTN
MTPTWKVVRSRQKAEVAVALGRVVGVLDDAGTDAGGAVSGEAASGEFEQPAIVVAAATIARIHLRGAVMGAE